ncbi:LysM peptidoglycan-binding domain-containing protein [Aeoliella sp. SH292]|uniref:LysM peptidoglycan-binding domain-containing protein n=1 Tax=Aeoliella sp. SH292 TaxID=3454464 RepID=UPI003F9E7170
MSAIRPLATIAMLMVLGYFLWTRINAPTLEQTSESELALEGVPPLDLDLGDDAVASESAPPAFLPTPPTGTNATEKSEAKANGKTDPVAAIPAAPLSADGSSAMPELPPLPTTVPAADAMNNAPSTGTISGNVPSLGTQVPPVPAVIPPPAPVADPSSEIADAALAGAPPAASINALPPIDELPATEPVSPESTDSEMAASAAREFSPQGSAFAAALPEIDAALGAGKIEEAHRLLTQWYGDRSLTSQEQQEVDALLGQLAGSVIYSNEHRLEAPHRVAPGETLETIAQKYNVPWQLLAKINGVAEPSAVTPGQELKVLRGPFFAVVDVERQQLALMVAERYAGRFSVKTEGQATTEGEWVITQKQMPSAPGATSKQLVLETVGGQVGGPQLVIGPPSDSSPVTAGAILVAPTDQEDLFDILSIGSRVIIRR